LNLMRTIFLIFISIVSSVTFIRGQAISGDTIDTSKGDLIIYPITHATIVLQWNGTTIYVDPHGSKERFDGLNSPDLILITDIHGDHMNLKTLDAINTDDARFIVPTAIAAELTLKFGSQLQVISNGEIAEIMGFSIEAIPMYNLPESPDSRHTKGRGNGYLLTFGGQRIYVSGDTEDIPEMRGLEGIDVAFICMNLPYTMNVEAAASAVLEFAPRIVYPFHYRGAGGKLSDIKKFKRLVNETNPGIEVRLRDWYVN
jgi:L-ascorbate metabolism protein UlaG (beta-lactamase superfamily)